MNTTDGSFVPAFSPSSSSLDLNEYETGTAWDKMESSGAVFLPFAGTRAYMDPSKITLGGGNYWSSNASVDGESAYVAGFDRYGIYPGDDFWRGFGISVRLVTDNLF